MIRLISFSVTLAFVTLILISEAFSLPVYPDVLNLTLQPGHAEAVTVEKLPVADCRVVRGFLGTPVDGSIRSWDYRGTVREYPRTASDGVAYSFNRNDGLHITLGDDLGFDVLVLRGGAHGRGPS